MGMLCPASSPDNWVGLLSETGYPLDLRRGVGVNNVLSKLVIRCPAFRIFPVVCLAVAGCAAGPDYVEPASSALGMPDNYYAPASDSQPQQIAEWWRNFDDPQLADYVSRALDGNLDIAQSASRLRQAREALIQSRADYLPSLGASAGGRESYDISGQRSSIVDDNGNVVATTDRATTTWSTGIDASWSVDLFGGIGRSVEAGRADLETAGYNLANVRTAIAAEVALNYISLRSAQASLAIARDTLTKQDDNLQIARWRRQAGLVSSLDVEQARTQRALTASSIPVIETNFANAANRLAVLTGVAPGTITDALAENGGSIPQGPESIAVGIPADTLRQRPDVRAAERTLAAATARIGVAQSRLYPSLSINGDIGASALSIGGLADAITGSLFAGLSQLLFDGGATQSAVRSQEAAAEGAFAAYQQSVLVALEDVENALVALEAANDRMVELEIALDAAQTTAILANSQYRSGLTDFRTEIDAERSLLDARDSLSGVHAAHAEALVRLYLALGGGWNPDAPLSDGTDR